MKRGARAVAKLDEYILHPLVSPAMQLRTINAVVQRVQVARNAKVKPIVEIDLDLCAVMPVRRTIEALLVVSKRFRIKELAQPERLEFLPGYSDESWHAFITGLRLPQHYPDLEWLDGVLPSRRSGTIFGLFHELYWSEKLLAEDTPVPGLGAFVHMLDGLGCQVVFISGRWLEQHVAPSYEVLRRAGIPNPQLIIGNPRHETLVKDKTRSLSDAAIKARHQKEIRRRYGSPIAIIDDRIANRRAIVEAVGETVLSIAIAIPGFTCDHATQNEAMVLSTFERFDNAIDSAPERNFMVARYPHHGLGKPWAGLYEGLGSNKLPYAMPRLQIRSKELETQFGRPFEQMLRRRASASLPEGTFLNLCARTIPRAEVSRLRLSYEEAEKLSHKGLAANFPKAKSAKVSLLLSLYASWLHSRDLEILMHALGYPIRATGVHDLEEYVSGREIKAAIKKKSEGKTCYSQWVMNWVGALDKEPVNVGMLNPSLLVSMWEWRPKKNSEVGCEMEDAMDIHRLASHHDGDGNERYDPIEAAVNNVLHQREGIHGIRKEPIVSWKKLKRLTKRELGAQALSKSSVGINATRDAIEAGMELERLGFLTPWSLCH